MRRVPSPFETSRLVIRIPRPGDAEQINAAVLESLESLQPWMPWAAIPPSVEETRANIRHWIQTAEDGTDIGLSLFRKETGEYVGGSGLHRIDWSVPKFEIGYWCRTRFQGQGYITEAVRGIASIAFRELCAERVEIRCDARNVPSRRVAERAGFPLEATLRHEKRAPDGELRDTLIFALLRSEQERLKSAPETE